MPTTPPPSRSRARSHSPHVEADPAPSTERSRPDLVWRDERGAARPRRRQTASKGSGTGADARRAPQPKQQPKQQRNERKKKRTKKPPLTARTADKFDLYQRSVQAPEDDTGFYARYYKKLTGKPARVLREDFCGTALVACTWVTLHRDNRAIGVDLHGPTLAWGREHNLARLTPDQQQRVQLIQADVMDVTAPKADVLIATNFSYGVFKTRDTMQRYIANARRSLRPDGMFLVDVWGGSETQVEQEEERDVDGFTYVWDQERFDPLTHHTTCRIHFEFKDGSKLRNAFSYEWRLWSLPELREMFEAAGFRDVHVLWEGTERATGEGNGVFRRVTKGDADPAWIAYVVGRR